MSTEAAQAEYERLKSQFQEKARELRSLREELARRRYELNPPDVTSEMEERDRALLAAFENPKPRPTLEQMGKKFGVTRERVRQWLFFASLRRPGPVHFLELNTSDLEPSND